MAYYPKENYVQDRDVGACAEPTGYCFAGASAALAKEFDHLELLMTTLTEKIQLFLLDDISACKEFVESPERENHFRVWKN